MPDEETPQEPSQTTPLLSSDQHHPNPSTSSNNPDTKPKSTISTLRSFVSRFLTSKYGHYTVITLVALDVSCIFADFLISLHICEHTCHATTPSTPQKQAFNERGWRAADDALDVVSLVFSSLFVVELLASLWVFGLRRYLLSENDSGAHSLNYFHVLDAAVIIASFLIDTISHGIVEEVGSLVIVGRLWRVFKAVEEVGVAGNEELEDLKERVRELEKEVEEVKRQRDWWVKGARRGFGLSRGHSSHGSGQEGGDHGYGQGIGHGRRQGTDATSESGGERE